jgi:Tol biopolymer transport system component
MRGYRDLCWIGLVVSLAAGSLWAQSDSEGWDTTLARGKTRQIDFTTSEGTFMSVDLSPDGNWIVFDLLAHIYRVPAKGGAAESLTQDSGVALNYHPRYSPDGRHIAFISDRKGQNNLWIMDADGRNPRAVFLNNDVRAVGPKWTPDGQYILVHRPQGIWMYHRDGGEGVELPLARKTSSSYTGEVTHRPEWPSISSDGRSLYFHVRTSPERGFVDKDLLKGSVQLRRFDMDTRVITDITGGEVSIIGGRDRGASSGGAIAPEVSADGRWLAFARRIPGGTITHRGHEFGPRTALFLLDLQTGAERLVMDPITQDMAEGMKTLGVLPGYSWARDGKSIVLSQGGKIRRVWTDTGEVDTIPFTARVQRTISEMARHTMRITDEPFRSRFMRWHTASPDGKQLAFQAVGKIWIMELPSGTPRRLTAASFHPLEFAPVWSPDGQWIAFTSWDDGERGHLWKLRIGGGAPQVLTRQAGEYLKPEWSPDGNHILVFSGSGATAAGGTIANNLWYDVLKVPAAGGSTEFLTRINSGGRRPTFSAAFGPEGRVFLTRPKEGADDEEGTELLSLDSNGLRERTHATFPYAEHAVPSPDGRWLAYQEGDNVYLMPFPPAGTDAREVKRRKGDLPVKQLTHEGGLFPRWRDNQTLEFGAAHRYHVYRVDTGQLQTTEIDLRLPRRIPKGRVAITGARIITLENRQVIDRGTVVIEGSRITCVGECDTRGIAPIIDAGGKTIIPGLIDMHAHHFRNYAGVEARRSFETAIYLAYGVTANLEPSSAAQNVFPVAELIEAGEAIGPRTYSTGDSMSRGDAAGRNEVGSYKAAEQEIARRAAFGAVAVKQYSQPRRDQRQWIADAGRKMGLMVTSEGGDLNANLGMIMDGQTGWEHPLSYVPLHSDAARFFGKAGAVYSPTLVVGGPAAWNDEYFLQESNIWEDEKQRRFLSWRWLFPHTLRRTLRPPSHFSYPVLAEGLADIIREGGYGAVGGHGQHHGLASHWEIWMYASALGPMGALEVATTHGAHFLGAAQDLGSLRTGKLADLVVLNSNPLDNIRNTADIAYVMKGGILYDANTLDEIWPEKRPFGSYYWVDEVMLRKDQRPVDYWDRKPPSTQRR